MAKSKPELRDCGGCGTATMFNVTLAPRGEEVVVHARQPHRAPCGRPCYEGRDVSMQDVYAGRAHHPRECECTKVDKRHYA